MRPAQPAHVAAPATETGSTLLDECEPHVREIEERMLLGISQEECTSFRHRLRHGHDELAQLLRAGPSEQPVPFEKPGASEQPAPYE